MPFRFFYNEVTDQDIANVVAELGLPLVVKPNGGLLAKGVSKVERESEMRPAIVAAQEEDKKIIVQKYMPGEVYRVTVFDNEIAFVLRKGAFQEKGTRVAVYDLDDRFKQFAVQAVRATGLRLCGVDMIINGDHTNPETPCAVIECNARPSLRHYAEISDTTYEEIIDLLQKVLEKIHQQRTCLDS